MKPQKLTKEEIRAACDELVEQGILKVVGVAENGDPIYQETDAAQMERALRMLKKPEGKPDGS